MQPSVFGRPTFRDSDAVRDIWRTTDERKSLEVGPGNPLGELVDEMMQDNSKAKLATLPVDEVIKEEEGEKFESISNRAPEQSVFTKLSNKTYISALQK
jgi:hypothetical protein